MGSGPRLPPALGTGSAARGGQAPLATARGTPPGGCPGGTRGPFQGPHPHTTHAQGTRAMGPWGEGRRLTPHAPCDDARLRGETLRRGALPDPRNEQPGRGSAQRRTPIAPMGGLAARPTSERPGEGECQTPNAPGSRGGARPPRACERPAEAGETALGTGPRWSTIAAEPTSGSPTRTPPRPRHAQQKRAATGAGQPQEVRTTSPPLRHRDTAMAEPTAPRKMRPGSPTLDATHEVIRALGLRGGDGDPPLEDADSDSDPEMIPEAPRAAHPRGPRRQRAACTPSAPRGSRATAPGKAGAPGTIPDPPPMTGHCPQWGTRLHAPPCATV